MIIGVDLRLDDGNDDDDDQDADTDADDDPHSHVLPPANIRSAG
jgi:hypothetical protein